MSDKVTLRDGLGVVVPGSGSARAGEPFQTHAERRQAFDSLLQRKSAGSPEPGPRGAVPNRSGPGSPASARAAFFSLRPQGLHALMPPGMDEGGHSEPSEQALGDATSGGAQQETPAEAGAHLSPPQARVYGLAAQANIPLGGLLRPSPQSGPANGATKAAPKSGSTQTSSQRATSTSPTTGLEEDEADAPLMPQRLQRGPLSGGAHGGEAEAEAGEAPPLATMQGEEPPAPASHQPRADNGATPTPASTPPPWPRAGISNPSRPATTGNGVVRPNGKTPVSQQTSLSASPEAAGDEDESDFHVAPQALQRGPVAEKEARAGTEEHTQSGSTQPGELPDCGVNESAAAPVRGGAGSSDEAGRASARQAGVAPAGKAGVAKRASIDAAPAPEADESAEESLGLAGAPAGPTAPAVAVPVGSAGAPVEPSAQALARSVEDGLGVAVAGASKRRAADSDETDESTPGATLTDVPMGAPAAKLFGTNGGAPEGFAGAGQMGDAQQTNAYPRLALPLEAQPGANRFEVLGGSSAMVSHIEFTSIPQGGLDVKLMTSSADASFLHAGLAQLQRRLDAKKGATHVRIEEQGASAGSGDDAASS